ncbi:MAG: electron transfer flavoprotein subunit beta/FixA family protein [Candidatus Sericytochromatia bacterium]|nr:electron transfer flavoprotein subunit beta/FixA family protein [Candidatus Tanganyikabacteria bacterium]
MRVVVCVKVVPDTTEPKRLGDQHALVRSGVQGAVNPMDDYALEVALKWKDAQPDLDVVVLTMGPDDARAIIKKCLAKGADRAVLVSDAALAGTDAIGTARVLAAAIRKIGDVDAVLCGVRSSDGESAVVGPAVAELLDLPQLTTCKEADLDASARTVTANREVDGALEVARAGLPALLTVTKASFEPRLANFKGIQAANKKEILGWTTADLGIAPPARQVLVTAAGEPPQRPASQVLTGTAAEVAQKLAQYLTEQKLV